MLQRSGNAAWESTLAGKTVLVTGHTGFKGSWLCQWLHRLEARVIGYALAPPTEPNNFELAHVATCLANEYRADIRDLADMRNAIRESQPDLILHLAAQTTVGEGYRTPRETFEVNVIGTATLLDAIREQQHACAVVLVSSDKCYENVEQVWGYRETDRLGGRDPYSASKGAMEILASSYRHSFFPPDRADQHGVRLATARAGNVIGGGDWTREALLVDVVESIRSERPVQLRSPHAVRPWQHVLEPLSGYLRLAVGLLRDDDPDLCGAWNFGPLPGQEIPVEQLVERIACVWGQGHWESPDVTEPVYVEAGQLRLAVDKAVWQLGWRPRWDLAEAIEQTVNWYREYYENQRAPRELCLACIARYESSPCLGAVQDVH